MPARTTKRRILVVDDDASIRQLIEVTLTSAGYAVEQAESGERALAAIRRKRFDLIVLDINMPGMSGYEVLDRLRAMPSKSATPVFVVTANGPQAENVIPELRRGAVGRLSKPFAITDLQHGVEEALGESAGTRESRREMQSRAADIYGALVDLRSSLDDADDGPTSRARGGRRR
jgi:two-component system chemotaxis response regulator CheY